MGIPRNIEGLKRLGLIENLKTSSAFEELVRWKWPFIAGVAGLVLLLDVFLRAEKKWDMVFWWLLVYGAVFLVWTALQSIASWKWKLGLVAASILAAVLTVFGVFERFPSNLNMVDNKIDDVVEWMVANWRGFFIDIRNNILKVLVPLEKRLLQIPWWLFTGAVGLLAWRVGGNRVALIAIGCFMFLAVFDIWDEAMRTLAVVGFATALSIMVAVPAGIAMAKNNVVETVCRPFLDLMQVMPSFVYLIPAIYFLGLGKVPAMLATMIYAMPPAMRLTNLGIRLVSPELKEAAMAFGTTSWQMLYKVEIPLARPTIMAGVNQTIMMALAMVVIASLVGTSGTLGSEVLLGVSQLQTGTGIIAGLGIVAIAITLDRISQSLAKDPRQEKLSA